MYIAQTKEVSLAQLMQLCAQFRVLFNLNLGAYFLLN
jgi:hypothetical protein